MVLSAAAVLLWPVAAIEHEVHRRFLFISSPTEKTVFASALPTLQELALPPSERELLKAVVLIDGKPCEGVLCTDDSDEGLKQPEGLAIWHAKDSATLFVADPAAERIYSYPIYATPLDEGLAVQDAVSVGTQKKVATGIPLVYGLALDGFGNLYYVTTDGAVGKIDFDQLHRKDAVKSIIYNSQAEKKVSGPLSLAADSFYVYWGNSVQGNSQGTVVKAFERDSQTLKGLYPEFPKVLAQNTPKAMGICLAHQTVFFTAEAQFLYAVKSSGGGITEVNGNFTYPRGCAYDGENTLYVADQAGFVFSLASNYQPMRNTTRVSKVVEVTAPSWLVVFTNAGYSQLDASVVA